MAYQPAVAAPFQPCDTYFVESYDEFPQLSAREHAKLVARECQYAIAEEMNKQVCDEYEDDILDHMLVMDTATLPEVESIDIQHEIQWFMRPYLLDFLIEAHGAFHLQPATLFLTINLLDRYCSRRVVYKRHYQLVGCAALLIAAKYGDKKDRVPTIKELKAMCCSLYDDDMFVQMEWHVLQTLGWTIGHPTVDGFLQMAVMDLPYDPPVEHLALYILEIALFHRAFVSRPSATLALSALALARCILGRQQPDPAEWAAGYDHVTLVDLSQHLMQPSQVLFRKYSSAHYSRVARVLDTFLARQAELSRAYSTPPAPPVHHVEKTYHPEAVGLATPQKSHFSSQHGYLTPPITPENPYQTAKMQDLPPTCPPSPSPAAAAAAAASYPQYYDYSQRYPQAMAYTPTF